MDMLHEVGIANACNDLLLALVVYQTPLSDVPAAL